MKKHILRKDFLMEIRRNKSRFLSILAIVTLGVAFFAGIRASGPDMRLSADAFYDDQNMMDIQVIGTLGLTDEDADAVKNIQGVKTVTPSYFADLLCTDRDSQYVIKFMSLTKGVNEIKVTEGRLPETSGEILLDTQMKEQHGYAIGDTVFVQAEGEEKLSDTLEKSEFTVVGFGDSPFYLSLERGTSTVGDGSLDGFAVILPEDFSLEAYTELYIQTENGKDMLCYSDEYEEDTQKIKDRISSLEENRCQARYDSLQAEGQEAISDARAKIDDARRQLSDAEEELRDGEKELSDGEQELEDGRRELDDARSQLEDGERELEENRRTLEEGQQEISENETALADAQEQIDQGYDQLNQGIETYNQSADEYESNAAQLQEQEALLEEKETEFAAREAQLTAGEETFAAQKEQLQNTLGFDIMTVTAEQLYQMEDLLASYGYQVEDLLQIQSQLLDSAQTLEEGRAQLEEGRAQLQSARSQLEDGKNQLARGYEQLTQAYAEIESSQTLLAEKEAQLKEGKEQLESAKAQLEEGWKAWEEGEQELLDARREIADGEQEIADGEQELLDARKELEDGWDEYREEKEKADQEIADAHQEIADGEKELDDMEIPQWYVLDRGSNQTYVEYEQDTDRIVAIGSVFPVIFFLVAALICLTTMTRMVEEGRTQIGILKALGYRKGAIAAKYIFYSLLATAVASIIGILAGQKFLPAVIINAYGILYNTLPEVLTPIHASFSITSAIPAVASTTLAAFLACRSELKEVPAQLMRPQAPKTGKRILLERIGWLWRRLSFSQKSTMRNLFRYKKRFWMTVLGIGGCMGLLLVGFGLRDSILAIGDNQFKELRIFSGSLAFEEDISDEEVQQITDTLNQDERISQTLKATELSVDVSCSGRERSSYMDIIENPDQADSFFVLRDRKTQKRYHLDDSGVIITEKLAKLLDVKAGDVITIQENEEDPAEVTVTAVVENYFYHYIYITPDLYERVFHREAKDHDLFFITRDKDPETQEAIQKDYMAMDGVSYLSFTSDISERVEDMIRSMDSVIYVIVIAAAMLAFVVLYNLNNINICERRRELATLKVLGFYDTEVSGYVLRENIWLTFFGCFLGVAFGLLLHRYMIQTVEIDIMMFGRKINFGSFLLSILLTWLFSALVNLAMYFHLKRVNMVESLKSIE